MEKTVNSALPVSNVNRFEIVDIAKGIGIFFVVFAHVNYTPSLLTYIYSFHMPLFFIISGMLFNTDKYSSFSQFIKRRVKTLIFPYVLFYIFSLLIMFPLHIVSRGFSQQVTNDFVNYCAQLFLSQGSDRCVNAPLWFVPCLFAVEIMYYFISKLRGKYDICIFFVCAVLTLFGWLLESDYIPFDNTILPWSIDSAMFVIGFYAIGNLLFGKVKNIILCIEENKYKTSISLVITVLCAVLLVPLAFVNGKISLGSKILNNGFLIYLSGIVGTIGILSASVILKNNKLLKFCGLNSFYIMSTHYVIRMVFQAGLTFVGIKMYDHTSIVQTIVPFIIVMTCSIIFAFLYGKLKGHKSVKK